MPDMFDALARLLLDDKDRHLLAENQRDLTEWGLSGWSERHPDVADMFLVDEFDEAPAPAELLSAIGLERRTIGWVDCAREDDEHQVRTMVAESCRRRGLPVPVFPDDLEDAVVASLGENLTRWNYVPAVLRAVDEHLARVGLRLLLIERDNDEYTFAPVESCDLDSLGESRVGGCRIYGVDGLDI
ncbi:DUF6630 family protein [Flexivirga caeni]|uniref:DUF6630 domain-containing protein n=1 Tax=Flexivirga caeni TaxID=2294115 RepID=A0A3M9M755_9MICO|nr:hypothetical protein [Flexivirga caeni]RNI21326.1 hypothetical protein EFY87_11595 [Flexivirga caeni]